MPGGKKRYLVVIVGPTAVGKTAWSIDLARRWGCEVISSDSRQIYREMSIGTAKPTQEECKGVPHHFVDFLSVKEHYSAGIFGREALAKIEGLLKVSDRVLMVGGSGLYVKAVCEGLAPVPDVPEKVYRALTSIYVRKGMSTLLQELKQRDPDYYATVDKCNVRRVMRALAVCYSTGQAFSSFHKQRQQARPFQVIKIGLQRPREVLRDRIAKRVNIMIKEGLVEEARGLYGLRHYKALRTIGYQELFGAFEGHYSVSDAIEKIKINTCKYLRRQVSWLRRDQDIRWFPCDDHHAWQKLIGYLERAMS